MRGEPMSGDWLKALRSVKKDLDPEGTPPPEDDETLKEQTAERLIDAAQRLLKLEAEIMVMRRS